jgi:hypothetical protein
LLGQRASRESSEWHAYGGGPEQSSTSDLHVVCLHRYAGFRGPAFSVQSTRRNKGASASLMRGESRLRNVLPSRPAAHEFIVGALHVSIQFKYF